MVSRMFGGDGQPTGNPDTDPLGTVRRAPDNHLLAVKWENTTRDPYVWWLMDTTGTLLPQRGTRVAHWPVIGVIPGSPTSTDPIVPYTVDVELPVDEQAADQ